MITSRQISYILFFFVIFSKSIHSLPDEQIEKVKFIYPPLDFRFGEIPDITQESSEESVELTAEPSLIQWKRVLSQSYERNKTEMKTGNITVKFENEKGTDKQVKLITKTAESHTNSEKNLKGKIKELEKRIKQLQRENQAPKSSKMSKKETSLQKPQLVPNSSIHNRTTTTTATSPNFVTRQSRKQPLPTLNQRAALIESDREPLPGLKLLTKTNDLNQLQMQAEKINAKLTELNNRKKDLRKKIQDLEKSEKMINEKLHEYYSMAEAVKCKIQRIKAKHNLSNTKRFGNSVETNKLCS